MKTETLVWVCSGAIAISIFFIIIGLVDHSKKVYILNGILVIIACVISLENLNSILRNNKKSEVKK